MMQKPVLSVEAKYKLGNSYFCDDKTISHFREISKTCKDEGFELIEELQQFDDSSLGE